MCTKRLRCWFPAIIAIGLLSMPASKSEAAISISLNGNEFASNVGDPVVGTPVETSGTDTANFVTVSATARQTITLAQGRVATTFVDITNNDQSNERTVTITVDASFLNGFPGAATLAFPGLADLTLSMSSTNINTLQDPGNGTSTLTASTTAGSPGGTLLGAFLDEDGSTGVLVKEDVGIANQFFDLNQEVTVVLAPGAIFSFELTSTLQPTGEPFEPIPEPGTIAMALTALPLMGLGYYVRRRSQA